MGEEEMRKWYAGQALIAQGPIPDMAGPDEVQRRLARRARLCFAMADAMIAASKQEAKNG